MDSIRNSYVKPSRLIRCDCCRTTLLSVGFVMNIQLQVDLLNEIGFTVILYSTQSRFVSIVTQFTIITSVDLVMVVIII
jgi:hypothetical protein